MAKKERKRLVMDIQVEDEILLERPVVTVVAVDKPDKHGFWQAPKGKVFTVKDKRSGLIGKTYYLEDDKVDTLPRKSPFIRWWDNFGKWCQSTYEKRQGLKSLPAPEKITTRTTEGSVDGNKVTSPFDHTTPKKE